MTSYEGSLRKLRVEQGDDIQYHLPIGDDYVFLNSLIGKTVSIQFQQKILCIGCGRVTRKSFFQGYCYPCFQSSPETSPCIIRPELCRAHEGIGRDMDWETKHHLQPHYVYLSLTSHLKVGVTRDCQVPTRWIDQGATAAIIVAETPNRYLAGCIEVALKAHYSDRTSWQAMLKSEPQDGFDLHAEKRRCVSLLDPSYHGYCERDDAVMTFSYPVQAYPTKITSLNLDKQPLIEGQLTGIKGQYLYFDQGTVFNVRKFGGYVIGLSV